MAFDYLGYVILPLLIFCTRIVDVGIGTIRIISVSKGMKYLAPILGFFEILIWIIAINKIMTQASNFIFYIAYAGGFAIGTMIGMYIENKLSFGKVLVRVITHNPSKEFIEELRNLDHGITIFDGEGKREKVKLFFSIINRKKIKAFLKVINKYQPNTFYSIEDVKYVNDSFDLSKQKKFFGFYRKGK